MLEVSSPWTQLIHQIHQTFKVHKNKFDTVLLRPLQSAPLISQKLKQAISSKFVSIQSNFCLYFTPPKKGMRVHPKRSFTHRIFRAPQITFRKKNLSRTFSGNLIDKIINSNLPSGHFNLIIRKKNPPRRSLCVDASPN